MAKSKETYKDIIFPSDKKKDAEKIEDAVEEANLAILQAIGEARKEKRAASKEVRVSRASVPFRADAVKRAHDRLEKATETLDFYNNLKADLLPDAE
jgi:hypothetical protein